MRIRTIKLIITNYFQWIQWLLTRPITVVRLRWLGRHSLYRCHLRRALIIVYKLFIWGLGFDTSFFRILIGAITRTHTSPYDSLRFETGSPLLSLPPLLQLIQKPNRFTTDGLVSWSLIICPSLSVMLFPSHFLSPPYPLLHITILTVYLLCTPICGYRDLSWATVCWYF